MTIARDNEIYKSHVYCLYNIHDHYDNISLNPHGFHPKELAEKKEKLKLLFRNMLFNCSSQI